MSRMRIEAKVRKNADFQAIKRYLNDIGLRFETHRPTGKGHPFIRIDLPGGGTLDQFITCTPRGRSNPDAYVSKLRRALISAGALPPKK